jgi:hypothetical protein
MNRKRKRAVGAGRKALGPIKGKTHVFTTRISAETRQALELEAAAANQSISQYAERLLRKGLFERRQERLRNRPLKAFCFLIEQLALRSCDGGAQWKRLQVGDSPEELEKAKLVLDRWRTDPFSHQAFKIAVNMLLNTLKPRGEIKPPYSDEDLEGFLAQLGHHSPPIVEALKQTFSSPEKFAFYQFRTLWEELRRTRPRSREELLAMHHPSLEESVLEEAFGLAEARMDLGLDKLQASEQGEPK